MYKVGDKIKYKFLQEIDPNEIWTGIIKSVNHHSNFPYRVTADWLNGEDNLFLIMEDEVMGRCEEDK